MRMPQRDHGDDQDHNPQCCEQDSGQQLPLPASGELT